MSAEGKVLKHQFSLSVIPFPYGMAERSLFTSITFAFAVYMSLPSLPFGLFIDQSLKPYQKDGDVGSNATSSLPSEMNSALTVELPNDR